MGAHTDILIVEDNRINAMVVTRLARDAGLTTEVARTGAESLALLSGRRYRLVIMDLQLPDMTGIEVTRIIRDETSNVLDHAVPIVALSAYTGEEDRTACFDAGMNEYLEKPLDNEALLGAVQRLVPGDSPRPPRPPQSSARPAQEPDGPAGQEPGGQEPDGPEPGGPDADAGSEVPGSRGSRSEVPGQAASGSAASGAADQRELPAFDGEELLSRLRSTKLARTVAEGFLTHLDDRAKAIHEALEDGTYTEIRSAAHNLASPAANAGAVALRALLKEMEAAAVAGDAEEVRATAARLDAEVAAARAAAERFLAEE